MDARERAHPRSRTSPDGTGRALPAAGPPGSPQPEALRRYLEALPPGHGLTVGPLTAGELVVRRARPWDHWAGRALLLAAVVSAVDGLLEAARLGSAATGPDRLMAALMLVGMACLAGCFCHLGLWMVRGGEEWQLCRGSLSVRQAFRSWSSPPGRIELVLLAEGGVWHVSAVGRHENAHRLYEHSSEAVVRGVAGLISAATGWPLVADGTRGTPDGRAPGRGTGSRERPA